MKKIKNWYYDLLNKGIQYLIESGCIESNNPADIAKFLYETEEISKEKLGEYLGEG